MAKTRFSSRRRRSETLVVKSFGAHFPKFTPSRRGRKMESNGADRAQFRVKTKKLWQYAEKCWIAELRFKLRNRVFNSVRITTARHSLRTGPELDARSPFIFSFFLFFSFSPFPFLVIIIIIVIVIILLLLL